MLITGANGKIGHELILHFGKRDNVRVIDLPTIPQGKARIRLMISATHSNEDLEQAVNTFEKVGHELAVI